MRKTMKTMICTTAAVLMMSLAACGGSKTETTKAAETTAEAETTEETLAETTETGDTSPTIVEGKFASVAEFAASDAVQSQLSSLKESLSASGMDISISGEDNKLIYTYTYSQNVDTSQMADTLKNAMASQADTFKNVASSIKAAVEVENPVVVVRYLNADGSEIYSEEFAAE
ncbi:MULTISPECIES: DUF4854 domain-containing protein [unclassified Candidatus Paralachnospira]|uniref:DUF4854 domain-containing protein n=1 Tax=unclassified Candidatus Paralachnospira TaxID=3099471 RepID=UPI003F9353CE